MKKKVMFLLKNAISPASFFIVLLFLFAPTLLMGESFETMFNSVKGTYTKDNSAGSNCVKFEKIIRCDSVSASELFNRVVNYISYNYSSNKGIEVQDRAQNLIVARGYYKDFYDRGDFSGARHICTAEHIIRIDVRDGRFKVTINVGDIDERVPNANTYTFSRGGKMNLINMFPINKPDFKIEDRVSKTENNEMELFYALFLRIQSTFSKLEKISKEKVDNDW